MNANPVRPGPDDREKLARLLPTPVERDLPSGRRRQLQEFVMSEIHQDVRATDQAPRRPPYRRLVFGASALTAAAAITAVVLAGTGGYGGSGGGADTPAAISTGDRSSAPVTLSGEQFLLAAATVAEQAPATSGTYWYVKETTATGSGESWTRPDGRSWVRGAKTKGQVVELPHPVRFEVGGANVTFEQLQNLPTEPDALKAWISEAIERDDVRTSGGKVVGAMKDGFIFNGLVSLVSQLPAPPQLRATAFRAIAAYPNVKNLGPVDGGVGLLITFTGQDPDSARLVVDSASSQIRKTNFYVTPDGGEAWSEDGYTLVAEWTDTLPH